MGIFDCCWPSKAENRARSDNDEQRGVDDNAARDAPIYDNVHSALANQYNVVTAADRAQMEANDALAAQNAGQNLNVVAAAGTEMNDFEGRLESRQPGGPLDDTNPRAVRRAKVCCYMMLGGLLGLAVGIGGTLLALWQAKLLWAADEKAQPTPPTQVSDAFKILTAWLAFPDKDFWAAFASKAQDETMSVPIINYVANFLRLVVERSIPLADRIPATPPLPPQATIQAEYAKWKAKGLDDTKFLFSLVADYKIELSTLPGGKFANTSSERSYRLGLLQRITLAAINDMMAKPPTP